MRAREGLLIAAFLALAPPAPARVALVLEGEKAARAAASQARGEVSVLVYDRGRLRDPIQKGRFLASAAAADVVLAAAHGRACAWLARELEGVQVRCIPPFNGAQVLDYAREARWKRVAAIHSPAYERVFARLKADARARGIELKPVLVRRARDLAEAVPRALADVDAVWLLEEGGTGDGPGFQYLVEQSLSRRVPLITAEVSQVAQGAFLGIDVAEAALLRHAVAVATAAAGGEPLDEAPEPPAGRLLLNEVLSRRWGQKAPGGRK